MTTLPQPPRLRTGAAVCPFRVFRYSFAVATRSALAIEFLRRLYGPPVIDGRCPALETFSIFRGDECPGARWEVYAGDRRLAGVASLGAALDRLERAICWRIIESHPDLIAMHSATVITDGGAVFLSGPSGAGKSTLSLALAALGYRVGGDDVALLDPRGGTIQPVPRCFHLDARSRRLLRGLGLAMPERALRYGFMTPADLGVIDPPALPVKNFLYLGPGGGRTARVAPLSQAEMIVKLLSETGRGAYSPGQIMGALRPLVIAAGCFEVLRGRLSATAAAVAGVLEQVRSSGT